MTQEKFDDNGMVFGQHIKFIYKDVETDKTCSEDVPYVEACSVIEGKGGGSKMVKLPKAGWIESNSIKKFYSTRNTIAPKKVVDKIKGGFNLSDILWSPEIVDDPFGQLKTFLEREADRVTKRTEITGLKDPRSRLYPVCAKKETYAEMRACYLSTVGGNLTS